MNILVTGGAGFIGSWLAEALLERGHTVWIVDDLSTGFRHNVPPAAHFLEADLCSPEAQTWIREARPAVVFHQAAQLDVRKSVADPVFDARVNILGTLHLLESCSRIGVRQVLFASSGGTVYGEPEVIPVPETHPIRPVSPYGIAKASVELYLDYYRQQFGLQACTLRYGNVYGPRQNPHGEAGVVAIFAQKLLAAQQPVINGTGEQTRDYVHVHDVVAANLAAFDRQAVGAYNIGTGIETNVVQVFELLNARSGQPIPRVHGPAKAGEQQRIALDCRRAAIDLGWQAQIALESGLAETFDWFKGHQTP